MGGREEVNVRALGAGNRPYWGDGVTIRTTHMSRPQRHVHVWLCTYVCESMVTIQAPESDDPQELLLFTPWSVIMLKAGVCGMWGDLLGFYSSYGDKCDNSVPPDSPARSTAASGKKARSVIYLPDSVGPE